MKILLTLAFAGCSAAAFAQEGNITEAKRIYVERVKPAIRYKVELERDGRKREVPTTYEFQNGDALRLKFELNKDAYIYVLNRTVEGNPDTLGRYMGEKGIEIIREEDSRRRADSNDSYNLLFPSKSSQGSNLLRTGRVHTVPFGDRAFYFRENPGVEKLFIVLSERPLDIQRHFNLENGNLRDDRPARDGRDRKREPGNRNDSNDSVLDQLNKELVSMASNTAQSPFTGKTLVEGPGGNDGYGVSGDPSKPSVTVIDLKHFPASRR